MLSTIGAKDTQEWSERGQICSGLEQAGQKMLWSGASGAIDDGFRSSGCRAEIAAFRYFCSHNFIFAILNHGNSIFFHDALV